MAIKVVANKTGADSSAKMPRHDLPKPSRYGGYSAPSWHEPIPETSKRWLGKSQDRRNRRRGQE